MAARIMTPGSGSRKVGSTIKGVGVGVGVFVGVGVGFGVGVGVFVGVGVGVFVGVDVGVFVGVGVCVLLGVGVMTATGMDVGSCVCIGVDVGVAWCASNGKLRINLIAKSSTRPTMAATPQLLRFATCVPSLGRWLGRSKNSFAVSGWAASILYNSRRSQYKGAGKPDARA